jgi:predicted nucleic acid-binding protein
MTFDDLTAGSAVFIDANIFVYAFAPDPQLGPACCDLLKRVELDDLHGLTSAAVLSNVAHRLMTLEACSRFNWPYAGIAARMQSHPSELKQLSRFRDAIDAIRSIGVHVQPVTEALVTAGAGLSQQHGLMSNDALVVAAMEASGLANLASHDADFDRVPGVIRFAPA